MFQISKDLLLALACTSVLAACAGKVGSDKTIKTASQTATQAAETKATEISGLTPSARFVLIPKADAKKSIPSGTIKLVDPANSEKFVVLTTQSFRYDKLMKKVVMNAQNESGTWSFKVVARCEEKRGDVCDLLIAIVERTELAQAEPVTIREALYFHRERDEALTQEQLDDKDLVLAYKYTEGLEKSLFEVDHLILAIQKTEELRTPTTTAALLNPPLANAERAERPTNMFGAARWEY